MLFSPANESPPLPCMNREMVARSTALSRAICPILLSLELIAVFNWSVRVRCFLIAMIVSLS